MDDFLTKPLIAGSHPHLFGAQELSIRLAGGLIALVGPNGAGKTEAMKLLRDRLRSMGDPFSARRVVYLSAGRNSVFEHFRSAANAPGSHTNQPAAIGNLAYAPNSWQFESTTGMFLRLKDRPDLLLKLEARLQALYQRRLRLEWTQSGLQVGFIPTTGGVQYYANAEASGLIQLIPLLAATYDEQIGALLVDEPEISLHPQLQAFLRQELEAFAGDPLNPAKKLVAIATHSSTMLPLRRISDIPQLVYFTDRTNLPSQLASNTEVLKSAKLGSLVARLGENHKLAFFARRVLLVEGPSDEIVVSGVALKIEHPLLGSNTQIVPVTGKGQFIETARLFRLMGKDVFVLCDLDGLADNNQLVNLFREAARNDANASGMGDVLEVDRSIRDKLNTLLDSAFQALMSAASHNYWTAPRKETAEEELKAKRRAVLATLLSTAKRDLKGLLNDELVSLRTRYDALLAMLAGAGCVVLRRGTVEDYYFNPTSASVGKPEAAAAEMEHVTTLKADQVSKQFDDVVRALQLAVPLKKIDENALLREQLGSLCGAALQFVEPGMSDEELNSRATANFSSSAPVFRFANRSIARGASGSHRRIEVRIISPLFVRDGFPFAISDEDNLTAVIAQKLPSTK